MDIAAAAPKAGHGQLGSHVDEGDQRQAHGSTSVASWPARDRNASRVTSDGPSADEEQLPAHVSLPVGGVLRRHGVGEHGSISGKGNFPLNKLVITQVTCPCNHAHR